VALVAGLESPVSGQGPVAKHESLPPKRASRSQIDSPSLLLKSLGLIDMDCIAWSPADRGDKEQLPVQFITLSALVVSRHSPSSPRFKKNPLHYPGLFCRGLFSPALSVLPPAMEWAPLATVHSFAGTFASARLSMVAILREDF